jgi:hypothetical protein
MATNHRAVLARWEEHGAVWRTLHLSDRKAIVELCSCQGEPVDRLESDDPELIRFLRDQPTSETAPV